MRPFRRARYLRSVLLLRLSLAETRGPASVRPSRPPPRHASLSSARRPMTSLNTAAWRTAGRRAALDRHVTGLFIALFVVVAYYTTFRLPFHFPPTRKIASPSLVFGFNNAVAMASVVVLLAAATLFLLWRRAGGHEQPMLSRWFRVEPVPPAERIRPMVFALMVGAHAVLTLVMWVKAQSTGPWSIDFEASHFLWRLQLMELFGSRPYLDFQHEYGPALLYVPMLLHRALRSTGLSLEAAYYISHLAGSVLGIWMILLLLNQAVMPRSRKEIAFCLLAAAGLVPYMGLNGNLVRYLPPYVSVLVAHRLMSGPWWKAGTLPAVTALGALNVLISPEIGVAFVVGWGAYCLFLAGSELERAVIGGSGLVVTLALTALTMPREYAGSLFSFSGGANNFPLLPAAHIVLYLVTVFLAVPRLFADALPRRHPEGALLFALASVSVVMIPGALTRADPPHVLFFGLGVSLLLFVLTGQRSRRAFALYAAAYAVVVIGGVHVSNARSFYGASLQSLRPSRILAFVRSPGQPALTDAELSRLASYPPWGLPYCSYGVDRRTMAYLWAHRHFEPEYYCGIIGVYSEEQLARKISDTIRHQYLLVRKGWLPTPDVCRRHLDTIRRSFVYHAWLRCKHDGLETDVAVNRAIVERYRGVEEVGPYTIMKRVGDP